MIYNDEQWEVIKKASNLYESAKQQYIRNASRALTKEIIDVYESATGKKMLHKNLSCAACVLRVYQTVGKTYFDDFENHQNKNSADLEERKKIELNNAEQSTSDGVGNAKPNRRNKKKN